MTIMPLAWASTTPARSRLEPLDADRLHRYPAQGEEQAFAELVVRTQGSLTALTRRLVGDDDDAADVVQEAYPRAWRARPTFRGDAQASTSLYTIATSATWSHLRRRRRLAIEPSAGAAPIRLHRARRRLQPALGTRRRV